MGVCCSCCGGGDNDDDKATTLSSTEIELQAQQAEKDAKSLAIARGMSAPTIEVIDRVKVNTQLLYLVNIIGDSKIYHSCRRTSIPHVTLLVVNSKQRTFFCCCCRYPDEV